MSILELVKQNFVQSIETKQNAQAALAEPITQAIELIVATLKLDIKCLFAVMAVLLLMLNTLLLSLLGVMRWNALRYQ